MARSSSSKKARSRQLTMQQRLLRWCFRPRRLVIVTVLALAALFWPQLRRQLPEVDSRPEYQVGIGQISVTPPPRWVPENLVEEVLHRVGLDEGMSLQDATLSERIAAAFVTYPWIQTVHRVSKSFPAQVHVEVTYRRPVGIVRGMGGYYPIDEHGCVLPGNDFSPSDIDRYPIIENISSVPDAGQGHPWGDPTVEGAARLATLLMESGESGRTLWESWNLTAIVAPSMVGLPDENLEPEYRMRVAGGSTIIWGRAPGTEHPGELSVAKKLQRLSDYHTDHHGFDDAPVAYILDVREWRGIARRQIRDGAATR